ncbi:hypothetical protein HY604_01225 [Candidatus Peregrinibacteria bacterium]|nr:hypothetical protein [Candidatus Peregrinibacteria bacterium]
MVRESFPVKVENGRFENLETREVGFLLAEILKRALQCISCEGSVAHPIDVNYLVDRYTRAGSTDGVVYPIDVRGIDMKVNLCRPCSDIYFDQACHGLGIAPVTDVNSRLTVTRELLEWAIRDREAAFGKRLVRGRGADEDLPVSGLMTSRRDVAFKRERNLAARSRRLARVGRVEVPERATRSALSALRAKLVELERLQVDGVPNEDVPRICEATRKLIIAARYVPVSVLAMQVVEEARGIDAYGRSKFGWGKSGMSNTSAPDDFDS